MGVDRELLRRAEQRLQAEAANRPPPSFDDEEELERPPGVTNGQRDRERRERRKREHGVVPAKTLPVTSDHGSFNPDPDWYSDAPPDLTVSPTPEHAHLESARKQCGNVVYVDIDGVRHTLRCLLWPAPHPQQPHCVFLDAPEEGDHIFLGWYHAGE